MAERHASNEVELKDLSHRAEILSHNLNKLCNDCGHESTSTDISRVADELILLATELRNLDRAVKNAQNQYTDTFNEDLGEICHQLGSIFEDTSDCCQEMHKTDKPGTSAIGWLRKKKYVEKLQKHLEANKTTLIVMRTVFHHGKKYGLQNSPGRLAESAPHILQEDRVILESVFASRNAITDLRNTTRKSHEHTSSTSSAGTVDIPTFEPGAHGRNLSTATGVDIPSFEDVLPHGSAKGKQRSTEDPLARRFSRRGVRLAVHSSILDLNSHDIPSSLRKRWIRKARLRRSLEQQDLGCPLDAQLSRISKVNSSPSAKDVEDPFALRQTENIPEDSQQKQSGERGSEEVTPRNVSKAKKRSLTLMATPMGKTIGRVIKRLGTTNLNQAEKKDDGTTRMNQIEGNNKDKQRLGTTSLTPIEGRDEGKLEDETERSPDKA